MIKRRVTLCRYVYWMVNRLRYITSRKKIPEVLSTTDGKKNLEIDCKNLEISEICTDEKSRDLRFSRNVNLEKKFICMTGLKKVAGNSTENI